jgi:hypothetical protein
MPLRDQNRPEFPGRCYTAGKHTDRSSFSCEGQNCRLLCHEHRSGRVRDDHIDLAPDEPTTLLARDLEKTSQPPASLLRKVRKVNGSECARGSQNAGRNASKIRELFQRRLANDWAKNGYFQYSVTRTVCEVFGTPRAVAIMGGHESGR